MPTETLPETGVRGTTRQSDQIHPLYNVVLLDDDDHSYQYVTEMISKLLGCPSSWAFEMAREVDVRGRVIVNTAVLEEARDLQRKIHAYGADWRIQRCKGSMSAIIEPAESPL